MRTPSRKRTQMLMEKEGDRLSSLPDELLHKILGLPDDTKFAAQTTVLSKRWARLWVSLPDPCFHDGCFNDDSNFKKFVLRFLQQYASSHLIVECDVEFHKLDSLALFQCQTLETLELDSFRFLDVSSPALTSVTTLCLNNCAIKAGCFDVMAAFPNLTTLCLSTVNVCIYDEDEDVEVPDVLIISGSNLVNLTMVDVKCSKAILRLPNLTCFKYHNDNIISFRFHNKYCEFFEFSHIYLPSLQHAELVVSKSVSNSANFCSRFFNLLDGLSNRESLKLNTSPLEVSQQYLYIT
ncbi:hypothetical protein Tsubulata_033878 [Turnera subulata]|uniref:F-box domain-containing protein n=1 Tax=Turnera subulata TaxID=218843 RepID=A0A9Q0G834_9ROSI|nr:hypothetical protein Tsubulata_033878 [Turnera subulata]